jgi:hypothetical protein
MAEDATATAGVPVAGPILSGRIYDANGVALPGARVVVEGTGAQATTNLQGEFSVITPDASGDVTLLIDYLGRPSVTHVVPAADRGRPVSLTLPAASDVGGDIVVTGASLLDNTARALNQQRTADNTVTIISSDAIGRFPDPNIAEALQRAPGVGIERDQGEGRYINVRGAPSEWSAVSVDGIQIPSVDPNTRAVDLDTLPSDIVANLEVTKSLLPYQDADSIAGAVNITTRSPLRSPGLCADWHGGGQLQPIWGHRRIFSPAYAKAARRWAREATSVKLPQRDREGATIAHRQRNHLARRPQAPFSQRRPFICGDLCSVDRADAIARAQSQCFGR